MLLYEPLEMLIVLDNAANVERIEEIIEMLDVPEPEGVGQRVTLLHQNIAILKSYIKPSQIFTQICNAAVKQSHSNW